jgi:hypothetical protein
MEKPVNDTALSDANRTITLADPCDLCSCMVRLYELISAPKDPTLFRAELFVRFMLNGKGENDGIYVTVKTSDLRTLLVSETNGAHGIAWASPGAYFWPLLVEAPGATRAECERFQVRMSVQTHQQYLYLSVVRITLYFSDSTTLVAEEFDQEILQAGSISFASP